MVKGVNKTVIEVNNTGSKIFEKIVFYVTPQYGNLTAKQLRRAAREFSFSFSGEGAGQKSSLRHRVKSKRRKRLLLSAALLASATGILVLLAVLLR